MRASLAHAQRNFHHGIAFRSSSASGSRQGRNTAQKHAWGAEIVLLSADGLGTVEIMRWTGKSKTCVWRWQERFAEECYEGLPARQNPAITDSSAGAEMGERVVALMLTDPPAEATHWTAAMMAETTGISVSLVQRIWRAHGLQPHGHQALDSVH